MGSNKCIINVGVDGWYKRGSERLEKSLKEYCPSIPRMIWSGFLPSTARPHSISNYGFKVHAFMQAFRQGHRQILWCDSSIYAIKNLDTIFEKIDKDGYYFVNNGYKLSQTATDKLLTKCDVLRDDADLMPEITTCVFGFDLDNIDIMKVFENWVTMEQHNLFNGSRQHSIEDSKDPRFLFCRHDQSSLSLAAGMDDIKPNAEYGQDVQYKMSGNVENILNNNVCLVNNGM